MMSSSAITTLKGAAAAAQTQLKIATAVTKSTIARRAPTSRRGTAITGAVDTQGTGRVFVEAIVTDRSAACSALPVPLPLTLAAGTKKALTILALLHIATIFATPFLAPMALRSNQYTFLQLTTRASMGFVMESYARLTVLSVATLRRAR